jgi:Leucine-rich repeat (LRR) protein
VSHNTKLTDLQVQGNLLTEIDVTHNPELNFFYCYNNQITSLDVSQNPRLNNLQCYNNRMSQLDATKMRLDIGVFYVYCGNQTTDGTTPQTLTLTIREDMKSFYTRNIAEAKAPESGYHYNKDVVLAE